MHDRIIYDRERLEVWSLMLAREQHPNWTYEQCLEESVKDEWMEKVIRGRIIADLTDKRIEESGEYAHHDFFYLQSKWLVENAPKELYQNINEYIDGKEISDIKIHGVSVPDIMNQFMPHKKIHFLDAMECMAYWKKNDYQNPNFCKYFFINFDLK